MAKNLTHPTPVISSWMRMWRNELYRVLFLEAYLQSMKSRNRDMQEDVHAPPSINVSIGNYIIIVEQSKFWLRW